MAPKIQSGSGIRPVPSGTVISTFWVEMSGMPVLRLLANVVVEGLFFFARHSGRPYKLAPSSQRSAGVASFYSNITIC
jgi:hypothetical protein